MRNSILVIIFLILSLSVSSQNKRALTIDDLSTWNRITESVISDDGSICGFVFEPWDGDPAIKLYDGKGIERKSFPYASGIKLTSDSRFMIFTIATPKSKLTELKLKKTKKEDMPVNGLGIFDVANNTTDTINRVKTFKVPVKWSGWIAYQCEPSKGTDKPNGKQVADTSSVKKTKPKTESEDNGYHLVIKNLTDRSSDTIKFVTGYVLAEEAPVIICSTTGDEKSLEPGVIVINPEKNKRSYIFSDKGKFRQLTISKDGKRMVYI